MSPVQRTSRRRAAIVTFIAALVLALPVAVLASHQFGDVPNSNIYHNDVDALVDAGVTGGCGGGNYCPNRSVTRGEMAAFMNRLGALGPGKTPVVNAAELDGINSTGFHRYNATAPFGATQYGLTGVSGNAGGAGVFDAGYASFPVPLAAAPTPHVITPGDPVPAGCSGSATSPAANAGHVCIWITYELNTNGGYNVFNQSGLGGASRHGFAIDMGSAAAGNYAVNAVYAVTGPLVLLPLSTDDEPAGPATQGVQD